MIVVIGIPWFRPGPDGGTPAGLAARIAVESARAGSTVQLIGKAGDDETGDQLLLALARQGVGHVAVLRHPSVRTPVVEPDDGRGPEPGPFDPEPTPGGTTARPSSDPGLVLEAADLELGLRYLVEFRAIVVAEPGLDRPAWDVIAEAARYAGAHVVAVGPTGAAPVDLADATVLETTDLEPDSAIARVVASFASAIDRGDDPLVAFRDAVGAGPIGER